MQGSFSLPERGPRASATRRRRFLCQLSALAAAPALFSPRESAAAPAAAPSTDMPAIQLGPHRISRLVVGSNPFNGNSYLGPHVDRLMREYYTPERIVEMLQSCEREGITAHQFSTRGASQQALPILRERGTKLRFLCLHADPKTIPAVARETGAVAMVHHGGATDKLFAEGQARAVHDFVKAAHDAGVLAGVSAHNPDCIRQIADEGWDVDFFMTCFYFLTRHHLPGAKPAPPPAPTLDPSVYHFYADDPARMTAVIRQVKQPCLAFKILAGGRRCGDEKTVREAFRFAFANIKPTDGVIVGMFPRFADEIAANAAHARQFGGANRVAIS